MEFKIDKRGQGGIISFFIMAMLAVIVALSVTWPVIDNVLNTSGGIDNMSSSASTLINLIPLFLALIWLSNYNHSVISSNDIYKAAFIKIKSNRIVPEIWHSTLFINSREIEIGGEYKTIKNTKAQGSVAGFFITLMLASIVALAVAWPAIDQALYGGGGYATNTFNFTGNTSEGEYINITMPGVGTFGKACYYFNTTGTGKPVGCLVVDVRSGKNTSSGSALALRNSTALDEAAILALISVSNTTTTNDIYTADGYGAAYNYAVSETVANGAWSSATMTGGANTATQNMSAGSLVLVGLIPLFLVISLLMLFIRPLL